MFSSLQGISFKSSSSSPSLSPLLAAAAVPSSLLSHYWPGGSDFLLQVWNWSLTQIHHRPENKEQQQCQISAYSSLDFSLFLTPGGGAVYGQSDTEQKTQKCSKLVFTSADWWYFTLIMTVFSKTIQNYERTHILFAREVRWEKKKDI